MSLTMSPTMSMVTRRRMVVLAAVLATQLALVGVAVAGQLSARLTGEEYRVRVGPVDPIDPFRGAYVDLRYPDLEPGFEQEPPAEDDERGAVYVVLRKRGDLWVAAEHVRERPDDGPYLACHDRDWRLRCGIESYFLPQDRAAEVERDINQSGLRRGERPGRAGGSGYVAVIEVDRWGNAAITRLERE